MTSKLYKHRLIISAAALLLLLPALLIYNRVTDESSSANIKELPVEELFTEVAVPEGKAVATFAAGCFWCTEAAFQELEGVESAVSGYAGGTTKNPTYEQVYTQGTDHREALQVIYDPEVISYNELLDTFWRAIDPTDDGGQFVDRGFSYTSAIFFHDDEQMRQAIDSKQFLNDSGEFEERIVTPIQQFTTFYDAEEYHQDFYQKSSERYAAYEDASGREAFKQAVWDEIQATTN